MEADPTRLDAHAPGHGNSVPKAVDRVDKWIYPFFLPLAQPVNAAHLDSDASKGFPHAETNEHSWKHETDHDYAQENQQLGSQ